jgi:hypothetical protein
MAPQRPAKALHAGPPAKSSGFPSTPRARLQHPAPEPEATRPKQTTRVQEDMMQTRLPKFKQTKMNNNTCRKDASQNDEDERNNCARIGESQAGEGARTRDFRN